MEPANSRKAAMVESGVYGLCSANPATRAFRMSSSATYYSKLFQLYRQTNTKIAVASLNSARWPHLGLELASELRAHRVVRGGARAAVGRHGGVEPPAGRVEGRRAGDLSNRCCRTTSTSMRPHFSAQGATMLHSQDSSGQRPGNARSDATRKRKATP